jgi:hypothetical protein
LQSFIINPVPAKDNSSMLITPEAMQTSTPVADKCPKPIMTLNAPILSNGYVSQPTPKAAPPIPPVMNSGYVTHSMFNVSHVCCFHQQLQLGYLKYVENNLEIFAAHTIQRLYIVQRFQQAS